MTDRTRRLPRTRARVVPSLVSLAALVVGLAVLAPPGRGRPGQEPPAADDLVTGPRELTVFGMRAIPGAPSVDPRTARYDEALRKILPGHGFELLGVSGRRVEADGILRCDLGDGRALEVRLLRALGEEGKVDLRVRLLVEGRPLPVFVADLRTPPDQLAFLDKELPGTDARLLIGVAAR